MSSADSSPSPILPYRGASGTVRGIFWMIVCTGCFVCVTGIVRYLGSELPAAESAFIRYAFGLLIMGPSIIAVLRSRPPRDLMVSFTVRGFVHSLGVICWFFAMARIPIAEVTAIGYVTPIFVTIGAAIFLGETLKIRRIMGVVAAFVGALIILRPGFEDISIGQIAQLTAAPLFATSYLMTKNLTGRTDSGTIVAMLTLACTVFLFPFALWDWKTPGLWECFWLFITALCATFGHLAMTKALQAAPVSVTQPVTFLQLVWASLLGIFMFGEAVDPYVILGGTIIVGAASFISHREAKAAAAMRTPPASAAKL